MVTETRPSGQWRRTQNQNKQRCNRAAPSLWAIKDITVSRRCPRGATPSPPPPDGTRHSCASRPPPPPPSPPGRKGEVGGGRGRRETGHLDAPPTPPLSASLFLPWGRFLTQGAGEGGSMGGGGGRKGGEGREGSGWRSSQSAGNEKQIWTN